MDQAVADAVERLQILALEALHRHEVHRRPTGRLEDRLRVRRVVLGSAHERSDEVGVDQAHHPPGLLKHAPPMMSAAAGLHSDDLRIEPIDGRHQLQAADLP